MKPITIALPGEKRNTQNIQSLFLSEGLISEADIGKERFAIAKLGVQVLTLRASDAVTLILDGTITGALNGIDILTENLLARRMKIRQEVPLGRVTSDDILGYDPLPPKTAPDIFSDMRTSERISLAYSGVFDTLPASTLRLLVRSDEEERLEDLSQVARRGDILTSYPYLVRTILSRRYGGSQVGRIKSVDGKVEALLANSYGESAVDIVDTGETARKNNLTIGPTLFSSYPAFVISEREVAESPRVRSLANAFSEISNTLYYNSSAYKDKFPRG